MGAAADLLIPLEREEDSEAGRQAGQAGDGTGLDPQVRSQPTGKRGPKSPNSQMITVFAIFYFWYEI